MTALRISLVAAISLVTVTARADVVSDVRAEIAAGRWEAAQKTVDEASAAQADSPAALKARSWLARGELAHARYPDALRDARRTRELATAALRSRALDDEPRLPIALGAAIEVEAQAMASSGQRGEAIALLQRDLIHYAKTSIAMRIQKNLNLLTLVGKPAPALEREPHFGAATPTLSSLAGRPVLLFFWAHWCPDCKADAPVIARLYHELSASGLVLIAPTQLYGAAAGGVEATPEAELRYIDEVRHRFYAPLGDAPAPVSAANFTRYGASSVPTIVVINRAGNVTLYHPGKMTYEELQPILAAAARR